jgi:hypothetical protein
MKKYLLGAILAAGLALAFLPQQASAYWVTKTSYRWDPCTCSYVCCSYRCWVPDCEPPYDPYCGGGYSSGYGGGYGGYGGGYGGYDSYSSSYDRRGGRFDNGRHHRR